MSTSTKTPAKAPAKTESPKKKVTSAAVAQADEVKGKRKQTTSKLEKSATPAVQSETAAAVEDKEPKAKAKKVKQVRDSFTMPKDEYAQIASLKTVLIQQGRPSKKSELLRAGLLLLSQQTPGALLACVESLPSIKTGRPRKD